MDYIWKVTRKEIEDTSKDGSTKKQSWVAESHYFETLIGALFFVAGNMALGNMDGDYKFGDIHVWNRLEEYDFIEFTDNKHSKNQTEEIVVEKVKIKKIDSQQD